MNYPGLIVLWILIGLDNEKYGYFPLPIPSRVLVVVQSMSMQDYGHVRQLLLLLPQLRI